MQNSIIVIIDESNETIEMAPCMTVHFFDYFWFLVKILISMSDDKSCSMFVSFHQVSIEEKFPEIQKKISTRKSQFEKTTQKRRKPNENKITKDQKKKKDTTHGFTKQFCLSFIINRTNDVESNF